jgi:hypothetical protein
MEIKKSGSTRQLHDGAKIDKIAVAHIKLLPDQL